ncbi:MAG: S8 family peptidase [Acidimicrobiales bacterium]
MKIGQVQRHLSGKGVTVAMLDEDINLSPRELRSADVSLRKDCHGGRVHQRAVHGGSEVVRNDHGTQMAAYVVGQGRGTGPDGSGIRGIAPNARLLFYSLDTKPEPPGKPLYLECTGLDEIKQINWAVKAGADIITISVTTTDQWPQMQRALHRAFAKGVVVVAATGATFGHAASQKIGFPAGYPGVVAVNAVDAGARPWRGNPPPTFTDEQSSYPVISAPGVRVKGLGWYGGGWDSRATVTGTSSATAIVAGCLALLKQKYPDATGNQLVQDLIHYTGGSHPFDWDPHYGFGIASVTKMLQHDPTRWPDVNPLLHGPKAAVKVFPMSSYGKATAADGSASGKASASPTAAAAGKTGQSGKAGSVGSGAGSSGGGVPPWVWVIVAVVVLGGAGATARMVKKRGRAEPGPGTGRV